MVGQSQPFNVDINEVFAVCLSKKKKKNYNSEAEFLFCGCVFLLGEEGWEKRTILKFEVDLILEIQILD